MKIKLEEVINILDPNENEKYIDYINRILSSRENKKDDDSYQEKHHILPKCLGGKDDKENLIYLYAQEHFYAHKMLAIENPNVYGLQIAWWNFCQCDNNGRRTCETTAEEYAEARERAAKANSELRKGIKFTDEHIKNLCGHGKPVINITTGEKFSSSFQAMNETGISDSHILDCCKGIRGSAGRDQENERPYIWRFQGEEDKDFGFNTFYFVKKIKCIETGEIYDSIRQASEKTGLNRGTIKRDCKELSSRQSKNRLHFTYVEEKEVSEQNNSNK